jgi:hypothetical protein
MRSPAPRTVAVCKPRYTTCLLGVGRCEGASTGHLEPHIHAHACTRDIGNFAGTHPRARVLDRQIYRDASLEEVGWAGNSSCKRERGIGQTPVMWYLLLVLDKKSF